MLKAPCVCKMALLLMPNSESQFNNCLLSILPYISIIKSNVTLSVCLCSNQGQTVDPIMIKFHIKILEGLGMIIGYFLFLIFIILLIYINILKYLSIWHAIYFAIILSVAKQLLLGNKGILLFKEKA